MSNWWANKLGGGGTAAPAAPAPVQRYDQSPAQRVLQPQPDVGQVTDDHLIELHKQGLLTDTQLMLERTKLHGGNRRNGAARFDTENCPECGDTRYFSRSTASGAGSAAGGRILNTTTGETVTAAPICFACGYRGGVIPQQTGELYDSITDTEEG